MAISKPVRVASRTVALSVFCMYVGRSNSPPTLSQTGTSGQGLNLRQRRLGSRAFAQQVDDGRGDGGDDDDGDDIFQVLACIWEDLSKEISGPGDAHGPQQGTDYGVANEAGVFHRRHASHDGRECANDRHEASEDEGLA